MGATDKLILVVEPDNKTAQKVVATLSAVGYEVVRTKEAQEAIEKITGSSSDDPPDIPDMITFSTAIDGHNLLRHFRTNPTVEKIPLVCLPHSLDLPLLIQNNFATAALPR